MPFQVLRLFWGPFLGGCDEGSFCSGMQSQVPVWLKENVGALDNVRPHEVTGVTGLDGGHAACALVRKKYLNQAQSFIYALRGFGCAAGAANYASTLRRSQ